MYNTKHVKKTYTAEPVSGGDCKNLHAPLKYQRKLQSVIFTVHHVQSA